MNARVCDLRLSSILQFFAYSLKLVGRSQHILDEGSSLSLFDEKHFLTIYTKLDLYRVWIREEGNLENSNEDEKSDKILKNLEDCQICS